MENKRSSENKRQQVARKTFQTRKTITTIRATILALLLVLTLPAAAQNDNSVKQASAPENSVKLAVIASPEGEAKETNIIESGGYSKFDKAAVAVAQKGNYNATGRWMKYFVTVEFKPQ